MITRDFNGNFYYKKELLKLSRKILNNVKIFKKKPYLSVFLFNNSFTDNLYLKKKIIACKKVFIGYIVFKFSNTVKIKTIVNLIKILNNDIYINGMLIQKPIPIKLNKGMLFNFIDKKKDVDLSNLLNFGNYITGYSNKVISCTIKAVLYFLCRLKLNFKGLKALIFGFSNTIGKPLSYELASRGMTIIVINKNDNDFIKLSKCADIIISAVGVPNFLLDKHMSFGSIIIDIGINKNANKVIGDINTSNIYGKINWITPVPGGIGPLTVLHLLVNILDLYLCQNKINNKYICNSVLEKYT